MSDFEVLRSIMDMGIAIKEMTLQRAEAVLRELSRDGEVTREQASEWAEELVERSRKSTEQLLALIRKEIDERFADLAARARQAAGPLRPRRPPARKKAAAKKAPAKKAAAKKAPVKKAPVKKAAVKKATPR